MSSTKISELAAAGSVAGDELIPIVQDGVTKRTTVTILLSSKQESHEDLDAIVGLTGAGLIKRVGDGEYEVVSITAAAETLLDDASVSAIRDTLGLQKASSGNAASGEVVMGNDTRLTNARTPSSHTHTVSQITDAGTAATKNVPASGDAAAGEVVKGNDSRLSDSRTPASHDHALDDITDAGTAAGYNVPESGDAAADEVVLGSDSRLGGEHEHTLEDITDAGTAAALDVPASGNATSGQVVKGNDTRLTNSRTPTSHTHLMNEVTNAGTAATRNVPSSGDATSPQVVLGSDSRLSDSRTPLSHTHLANQITDLGTAAEYDVPVTGDAASDEVVMGNDSRLLASGSQVIVFDGARTGETGGGSSKLDGISTGAITASMRLQAVIASSLLGLWQLVAGTDSEDNDEGIVRPDDYSGGNQKVWMLRGFRLPLQLGENCRIINYDQDSKRGIMVQAKGVAGAWTDVIELTTPY